VKPPKYFSNIKVKTWPKPTRRIEHNREYLMVDENDNTLIKGISNWAIINYETRSVVRKGFEFDGEYVTETNYLEPAKRKLDLELINPTYFEYKTTCDDLDHNGHMNNARYAELVFNTFKIDEFRKIKSFECEYIKELKYNEDAYIMYDDIRNNYAIYNSNDELSFVMRIDWR
jgi:acyl-ACP thioesterase